MMEVMGVVLLLSSIETESQLDQSQIHYDIDDFYGVATYQSADEYPHSWEQMPALKVETKIYHHIWDEEYDYTIKEAGKMKLYKLNKDVNVLGVSDSINANESEVGNAIHNVLHPDWDEIGTDEMNRMSCVRAIHSSSLGLKLKRSTGRSGWVMRSSISLSRVQGVRGIQSSSFLLQIQIMQDLSS